MALPQRFTLTLFNDLRSTPMWYLAAVLNGMWFEAREPERDEPPQ
ncbi:hypothetical protein [Xanthomonas nasturtii]|nr:hypothetical protein [Xanthomonas nasturtii]